MVCEAAGRDGGACGCRVGRKRRFGNTLSAGDDGGNVFNAVGWSLAMVALVIKAVAMAMAMVNNDIVAMGVAMLAAAVMTATVTLTVTRAVAHGSGGKGTGSIQFVKPLGCGVDVLLLLLVVPG
jgi:hypothetical protein